MAMIPQIVIPVSVEIVDKKNDDDADKVIGSINNDPGMTCSHVMWSHECDPEDFGHALDFLSLCMNPDDALAYVNDLQDDASKGKIEHYKVVDIFRAAKCKPADPEDDSEAKRRIDVMNKGGKQSPVMLVRGEKSKTGLHPIIADGYHRLSAAYAIDTEMLIPCIVADK